MLSVAVATQSHRSGLAALLRLVRSQLLQLALTLHHAGRRKIVTRIAAVGSTWTLLAFTFGGFYEKPWELPGVVLRVGYTIAITLCEFAARGFKPLFEEWTLSFEISRAVIRTLMANYGDRFAVVPCAQHIRHQSEIVGRAIGFFVARQFGLTTHTFYHNGLQHTWVRSKASSDKPRRRVVVLYFHGGAYAVLSPRLYIHFACDLQHRLHDRLQDKLGPEELIDVDILLANYRKIPEHPHPIPAMDAVAMYNYLIDEEKIKPSEIVVAGDSAGGGLTMSTLLRLRDEDPALLPAAGIVVCPFVDLEIDGDERKVPYCILADKPREALIDIFYPRVGHPSTWGDASAVHCDLRGLPPVYIQAAELDYILPHSQRLYDKAQADGVTDWNLEIFHNVPHVFSFYPPSVLPSAARGLDAMAEYAATKLAIVLKKA